MVERKGVSVMVSYAMIVAVIILSVMLVLRIATPVLGGSRDVAQVQQAQNTLTDFDARIREVASFGRGTSVSVSYSLSQGSYEFVPENDTIKYEIDTDANIISEGVSRKIGPVNMSRGNDTVIKISIDFSGSNIDLVGRRMSVGSGFYEANLRNNGTSDGKTDVEVELR